MMGTSELRMIYYGRFVRLRKIPELSDLGT